MFAIFYQGDRIVVIVTTNDREIEAERDKRRLIRFDSADLDARYARINIVDALAGRQD
ncbi:MAG: hypothetical protein O7G83_13655 [Proteobacteria bacterium]|nr:hypothetical protein [Pseudomonadota bacterium]